MKNNLAKIRKENNLTQEQLAEKVGVTRNFISMIESRNKECSVRVLYQIAKVLNVKPTDIFLPWVVTLIHQKGRTRWR